MSQYLPTINITPQVYDLLRSGSLYLQPGQWVRFTHSPPDSPPSRFVGFQQCQGLPFLWVLHGGHTQEQFLWMVKARRADINTFHNRSTP